MCTILTPATVIKIDGTYLGAFTLILSSLNFQVIARQLDQGKK